MSAIRPLGLLGRRIINRLLSGPTVGKLSRATTFSGWNHEIVRPNAVNTSIAEIRQRAQIKNLVDVSSIVKSGREYYRFRFNNGVSVVVSPNEVKLKTPTARRYQDSYFRVAELNIVCGGKEIDLLSHGLSSVCDHYFSFVNSGPNYHPKAMIVNEKGIKIETYRPFITICPPLNKEGKAYDGELLVYHWLHEFGHAMDLNGKYNTFTRVFFGGIMKYKLLTGLPFGEKQERNADAIGVKLIRGIIKLYGGTAQLSAANYLASAEEALSEPDRGGIAECDRVSLIKDFCTVYSDGFKALFRDEEKELKKRGLADKDERRLFQIVYRRERNVSGLKEKYGGSTAAKYDAMVDEWIGENHDKMIRSSGIMEVFDRFGFELERVENEIDLRLEYNFHTSVMLKSGIPWERYRSL